MAQMKAADLADGGGSRIDANAIGEGYGHPNGHKSSRYIDATL